MAAYTKKQLTEVENSSPKFGFGEVMEARFANEDLGTVQTGFSFHRVKPGKRQAFGHKHDEAEEVYVVIGGSGRVKLNDDIVELDRLDAVRVEPTVVRCFECGEDGIEFLAFGALHDGDGEVIPEWWTD